MALSVNKLTWGLSIIAIASAAGAAYELNRIRQIDNFNAAVIAAKSPVTDQQSYEAKFSTAYWLARNERYKEATLLFTQLLNGGTNKQRAIVQHNIGNIFFLRGLIINGTNDKVRDEAEYLFRQAKVAYVHSLKLDNHHWGTRHNLDRLLTLLPATPTPGVGDSDTPGLMMGTIPVGLP